MRSSSKLHHLAASAGDGPAFLQLSLLTLGLFRVYHGKRVWGSALGCGLLSIDAHLHAVQQDADLIGDGDSREPADVFLSTSGS